MSTAITTNIDNIVQRLDDGFWQTSTATKDEGWPIDTNDWCHLISQTHTNAGNYYAMQFAGAFFDNEHFFVRKTKGDGNQPWRKLYHDNNFDLLGKDIDITWKPLGSRLLASKNAQQNDDLGVIHFRLETAPGTLSNDPTKVAYTVNVDTHVLEGTKYGHWNLNATTENKSRYHKGVDPFFFGHVGVASYAQQIYVDSADMWGFCAEIREDHLQPNPVNSSLGAELSVFATGTDDNDMRCMLFLPANKRNPADGIRTEFARGIFVNTTPNTVYKDGILLRGEYWNGIHFEGITSAPGTQSPRSGSVMKVTGDFSGPLIDLGYVNSITKPNGDPNADKCAIQINTDHHIRWNNADQQIVQKLGRVNDTLYLGGMRWQGGAGAQVGYVVINIDGNDLAIPCHLPS